MTALPDLDVPRRPGAGLRGAMAAVRTQPGVASLQRLEAALLAHAATAEGPGGLFEQIRADAPRLLPRLSQLGAQHARFREEVRRLLGELAAAGPEEVGVAAVRRGAADLVDALARHVRAGAELVHQAYAVDIGGE